MEFFLMLSYKALLVAVAIYGACSLYKSIYWRLLAGGVASLFLIVVPLILLFL